MKILTVLISALVLLLSPQFVVAQNANHGLEALIILATISNVAPDVQKKSYMLPSGRERVIYDFSSKKPGKEYLTKMTP